MAFMLVTCPETVQPEMIEYEDSPLGMLLVACSRFRPACRVTCPRTCSARLDRRALAAADPTNGGGHDPDTGAITSDRIRQFVLEVTSLLGRRT